MEQEQSPILARGNAAVILRSPRHNTVIKLQQKPDGRLQPVSTYETDICHLLWKTVAETGLSRHVCQGMGTATTQGGHIGMAMEKLCGTGDAGVVNLEDFIFNAACGLSPRLPSSGFASVFRGLIFQTLFTLSSLTFAFKGLFRHNDLHLRNVCFTPWNEDHIPIDSKYVLRCFPAEADGGKFVDRHFCLCTAYRAVVIDFGWAALLPGIGPDFDGRFYKFCTDRRGKPTVVNILESHMVYKDCGMSQQVPCQAYDAMLLMYSIYTACTDAIGRAACPPDISAELGAFVSFYSSMYDGVPHIGGRLSLSLQRHLLRSRCIPGGSKTVPTTEALLRGPYFAGFRAKTSVSEHVFGLCPSRAVITERSVADADSSGDFQTPLNGKGQWQRMADAGSISVYEPPMGSFSELLEAVYKNIDAWKFSSGVRVMNDREETAWIAGTGDDSRMFTSNHKKVRIPRSPPLYDDSREISIRIRSPEEFSL